MAWFSKPAEYLSVSYEEDEEEITHTAENGYECADPDCICHQAEESTSPLPVPWEALRERK